MLDSQKAQGVFDKTRAAELAGSLRGDDDRYPDMRTRVTTVDKTQRLQKLFAMGPTARLAVRLLALLPKQAIARVPERSSMPFSDKPNRLQREIPGAAAAIDRFVDEQNLWADFASSEGDALGRSPFFGDPRNDAQPVRRADIRLSLRIAVDRLEHAPQVELKVLDADGKRISYYSGFLGGSYRWDGELEAPAPKTSQNAKSELRLSPLGTEWLNASRNKLMKQLSPELRQALLKPEEVDPLAESARLVSQIGDLRHQDVIGCLPDESWPLMYFFLQKNPPNAEMLLEAMRDYVEVDSREGLLLLKPLDPVRVRSTRTPRAALAVLARAVDREKALRIDDLADFEVACASPSSIARSYYEALAPGSSTGVNYTSQGMLRAYGYLSREQRHILWNGGSVRLLNNPDTLNQITHAVYYAGLYDRIGLSQELPGGRGWNIVEEPAIALPDGLPASLTLTAQSEANDIVYGQSESGFSRLLDPRQLAESVFSRERPDSDTLFQFINGEEFTTFRIGEQRSLSVRFSLVHGMFGAALLSEVRLDPDAAEKKLEELPAEFRGAYQKALAELRKMYKEIPAPKPKIPPP
jgi:hypothetical protein